MKTFIVLCTLCIAKILAVGLHAEAEIGNVYGVLVILFALAFLSDIVMLKMRIEE